MVDTESKTIDGMSVVVTQLPARRAFEIWYEFAAAVAPTFAEIAGKGGDVSGQAVSELFARLPHDKFRRLTDALFEAVTLDGVPILKVMDLKLQGKMFTYLAIAKYAFQVNYLNFTDGRGLGDQLRDLMKGFGSKEI